MTQPKQLQPGDRVKFVADRQWFGPDDNRMGTVVRLFEGWSDRDDGASLPLPYPQNWGATVQLDEVPAQWPYGSTDRFAPDVVDLELQPAA